MIAGATNEHISTGQGVPLALATGFVDLGFECATMCPILFLLIEILL